MSAKGSGVQIKLMTVRMTFPTSPQPEFYNNKFCTHAPTCIKHSRLSHWVWQCINTLMLTCKLKQTSKHKHTLTILTFWIKAVDKPEASSCCTEVCFEDDSNLIALGHKTACWVEVTEFAYRGWVRQATVENLQVVKSTAGVVPQAEVCEIQLESKRSWLVKKH